MVRVRALDDDVKLAADLRLTVCGSGILARLRSRLLFHNVQSGLIDLLKVHVVRALPLNELRRCN